MSQRLIMAEGDRNCIEFLRMFGGVRMCILIFSLFPVCVCVCFVAFVEVTILLSLKESL